MLLAFVDIPQRYGSLTAFPILASDEPQLAYLSMTEAVHRGVLTIHREGSAEPAFIIASNLGTQPILILECEHLGEVGDIHSTIQSVLLGPATVTKLPVTTRGPDKWQGAERRTICKVAMSSFPILEDQVGILAFLGRQFLSLEALGTPSLYALFHKQLMEAHILTAMGCYAGSFQEPGADLHELQTLAMALENATRETAPCHGSGDYSILCGEVVGRELRHNGHLVHLTVNPNGVAA